jgi:prophage regulatory protein
MNNYTKPNRILRMPEVMRTTGLARSTIYLKLSQGEFPTSVKLGERAIGWLEADVQDWIEEKILQNGV